MWSVSRESLIVKLNARTTDVRVNLPFSPTHTIEDYFGFRVNRVDVCHYKILHHCFEI